MQDMSVVHRNGFTKLSSSDPARNDPPRVNIIFVHGLRGHPRRTWEGSQEASSERVDGPSSSRTVLKSFFKSKASASNDGTKSEKRSAAGDLFWPKEYLTQDIPEARVWTYGYNADVVGGMFQANNKNSVSQHGRDLAVRIGREIENEDPILFVAHGLGGIIVKDAIHRSVACRTRTKLIVFLGTPHRGSACAGWGEIASNLARFAMQDSHKKIIKTLEVNSEVLDNIHEEFKSIVHESGVKIHSFQEARGISGMKGLDGKVVDDFSSKLDLPRSLETVESIDANHMQMVRCSNRMDERYRAISGVLKQFMRSGILDENTGRSQRTVQVGSRPELQEGAVNVTGKAPSNCTSVTCYNIPFLRNRRFVGPVTMLEELEKKLFFSEDCRKLSLGKTQVALEFAYSVKERWPNHSIFWVPALSAESFEQAYREIAAQCLIPTNAHELAGAYQADGQVRKAIEILEQVVAIEKKALVEDHLTRLASQHELAGAYQADGQVEKALEILKHVVAVKEKVLREDHQSRMLSRDLLNSLYAE